MSAQGAWDSDVISVEGLCMRYRTLDVLRDVAFRVHRGEVVVLLGPNGAGKTVTELRRSFPPSAVAGLVGDRPWPVLRGAFPRRLPGMPARTTCRHRSPPVCTQC